jgi:hypothetical protein
MLWIKNPQKMPDGHGITMCGILSCVFEDEKKFSGEKSAFEDLYFSESFQEKKLCRKGNGS